jgi:hypothetical protein
MQTQQLLTIQRAQHFVADAMCAFHQQLAAAFRGDSEGCRVAHRQAAFATAEAIRAARDLLYKDEKREEKQDDQQG